MTKRVLVVDDSATVRQQVRAALGGGGFDVVEASDGSEGAETIGRLTDLAAVICDVNMPRMNGIEMLETVKRDPKHTALPIVMLTTEGQHELVQRAKAAGAKGWIVKPFKPDLLLAAIRKITAT
ncbi:MAG TPA: response regulator [Polyangiaceae bacterium]|jgi:two-component system chemotaxis response regulator CheY|nr:response regulator [Polyangiaceae bacterium]